MGGLFKVEIGQELSMIPNLDQLLNRSKRELVVVLVPVHEFCNVLMWSGFSPCNGVMVVMKKGTHSQRYSDQHHPSMLDLLDGLENLLTSSM